MPDNPKLCELLRRNYPALLIEGNAMPEALEAIGAGSQFHIAILSPYGLTPLVAIDPLRGTPAEVIDEIVLILEHLVESWRI